MNEPIFPVRCNPKRPMVLMNELWQTFPVRHGFKETHGALWIHKPQLVYL